MNKLNIPWRRAKRYLQMLDNSVEHVIHSNKYIIQKSGKNDNMLVIYQRIGRRIAKIKIKGKR